MMVHNEAQNKAESKEMIHTGFETDAEIIRPQIFGAKVYHQCDVNGDIEKLPQAINRYFGARYLLGTMLIYENPLISGQKIVTTYMIHDLFKERQVNKVLEIGTYLGVGALLFSVLGAKVTTIDIMPLTEPVALWKYFGVNDKIEFLCVKNNEKKKEVVGSLDFDFAFIDGDHSYECAKRS